jgi:large subunit ribosomal protein L25
MEKMTLTAQVREKSGKGVARGLRRSARVPAVLYGHGKSTPISMGAKDVTKILNREGGEHALINLKLDGSADGAEKLAMIKDYQLDPRDGALIHVDLMEVAMNELVRVSVAVHLSGVPAGAKEGGLLQHGLREVEVECLPLQIPDHFDVNVSHLKVNESLHVRNLVVAEGIRLMTDGDATIATIQPPISEAKLEAMLTATPAAAATEGAEPELVKKPKKEGEAEAAPAEAKGKEAAPKEAAPKK